VDSLAAAAESSWADPGPLVAAARAGDAGAFAAIYRRFAPVVHGIALARVGPDDAEDVVQETFVAVHRSLGRLRDETALAGWIRKVAVNAARDRLRRRRRAPSSLDSPAQVPGRSLPEDREGALRRSVLARLQELPEPYRETLVWRLVEGLTGPEIAARTGLTPGSVRVNLSRGLGLLRPLLAKDGWR
jgi:RNA polymerase sigma-70 factor (ECF subfamily)